MQTRPLRPEEFQTLIEAESARNAASIILAAHNGDDRAALLVMWATWSKLVGGEPGNRPKDGLDSAEAKFCVDVVTAIDEGAEEPKVAANDERRRWTEEWRAQPASQRTKHTVVAAA